jgi:hypothetical protein
LRPDVLVAAARRFLVLLGGIGAAIVVFGLGLGALAGTPPSRSLSLGFYVAGSFLVLGGFLFGNRGPYRADGGASDRFGRSLRRATPEDVRDSINMAALLVVLGFLLLAVGVIIDSRFQLI